MPNTSSDSIKFIMPKPWWINEQSDYLYINVFEKKLIKQSVNSRSAEHLATEEGRNSWQFIAPSEIQENIVHEWGEYETISNRIAQKIGSTSHAIDNIKNASYNFATGLMDKGFVQSAKQSVDSMSVPRFKIDAPLIYQNSKRLEYTLTFNIVYTGLNQVTGGTGFKDKLKGMADDIMKTQVNKGFNKGFNKISSTLSSARQKAYSSLGDTGTDILGNTIGTQTGALTGNLSENYNMSLNKMTEFFGGSGKESQENFKNDIKQKLYDPITKLEQSTCPEMDGEIAGIKYPNIFKVYSSPLKIINIKNAAITSVQPTWKGPYIGGYPLQCELTITFLDINPLYKDRIKQKGLYEG